MPVPTADHVLVRIAATSLNLSDWECLVGSPLYSRIGGLRRPARRTLGSDIAGTVEAVGSAVTRFAVGDEVYGDNLGQMGGFAELARAPEKMLAHKPAGLTFVQASTMPQAGAIGCRALLARRPAADADQRRRGRSGSFAIQLAKRPGAHVTGVDNAEKLDFMRSLGADEVIDYRTPTSPAMAAVRPGARSGRPPQPVRLPSRAGARRHLPLCGWHRARAARYRHRRRGGGQGDRAQPRVLMVKSGPCALRPARRAVCGRRGGHPRRPHLRARCGARCLAVPGRRPRPRQGRGRGRLSSEPAAAFEEAVQQHDGGGHERQHDGIAEP